MYVKSRVEKDPLYQKVRRLMIELERTAIDTEETIPIRLSYHELKRIERLVLLDEASSQLTFHSIDRGRNFARDISMRKGKKVEPIREFGGGGLVLNDDFEAEEGITQEESGPQAEEER